MDHKKINDLKKRIKNAGIVAGISAAALLGTPNEAQAQNKDDVKPQGKEILQDNTADIARKTEQDFKNLADIKKETKDGINLSGEKLHSEEYGTKYGSITHYTFENGSTETQFFCEHGSMFLKNGAFYDKGGQKVDSEKAQEFLDNFRNDAIKGQPTVFMARASKEETR